MYSPSISFSTSVASEPYLAGAFGHELEESFPSDSGGEACPAHLERYILGATDVCAWLEAEGLPFGELHHGDVAGCAFGQGEVQGV